MQVTSIYPIATNSLVLIYIYIFVEPYSFVRKLLPQRVCDGRETWPYYSAPHGECHKGVGGRRFVAPEKSAARIPTLTEIDAMFYVRLRMTNARCRARCCLYMCKKAAQCSRGDARTLWHAKVPQLQLQNEGDAKKMSSRETIG